MSILNANSPEVQKAIGTIVLSARNDQVFRKLWLESPVSAIQSLDIPDTIKADLCENVSKSNVKPAISLGWLTGSETAIKTLFDY